MSLETATETSVEVLAKLAVEVARHPKDNPELLRWFRENPHHWHDALAYVVSDVLNQFHCAKTDEDEDRRKRSEGQMTEREFQQRRDARRGWRRRAAAFRRRVETQLTEAKRLAAADNRRRAEASETRRQTERERTRKRLSSAVRAHRRTVLASGEEPREADRKLWAALGQED